MATHSKTKLNSIITSYTNSTTDAANYLFLAAKRRALARSTFEIAVSTAAKNIFCSSEMPYRLH